MSFNSIQTLDLLLSLLLITGMGQSVLLLFLSFLEINVAKLDGSIELVKFREWSDKELDISSFQVLLIGDQLLTSPLRIGKLSIYLMLMDDGVAGLTVNTEHLHGVIWLAIDEEVGAARWWDLAFVLVTLAADWVTTLIL